MEAENNTNEMEDLKELTEEEAAQRQEQLLLLYGDALLKLFQYPRFQKFMSLNYKVDLVADDTTGFVSYVVEEVPNHIVAQEIQSEMLKKQAEAKQQIVIPSAEDVKKIIS